MGTAFMSEAFGQYLTQGTPRTASTAISEWMGRLRVKPGSRQAAGFRPPSR
jgi:hypothetical protein